MFYNTGLSQSLKVPLGNLFVELTSDFISFQKNCLEIHFDAYNWCLGFLGCNKKNWEPNLMFQTGVFAFCLFSDDYHIYIAMPSTQKRNKKYTTDHNNKITIKYQQYVSYLMWWRELPLIQRGLFFVIKILFSCMQFVEKKLSKGHKVHAICTTCNSLNKVINEEKCKNLRSMSILNIL